jgi:hypothetical protein
VFSAGTNPSSVRPEAIAVMSEIGIDRRPSPKHVRESTANIPTASSPSAITRTRAVRSFPVTPRNTLSFDPAAIEGRRQNVCSLSPRS